MMKLPSLANLEMRRTFFLSHPSSRLTHTHTFSIRVLFSIADIENTEDVEFDDEGNQVEAEEEPVSPVRCAVTITKPNTGALSIDCVAQNGTFQIDNISYYADGKLATELSAEADWKRRGLYVGPQVCKVSSSCHEAKTYRRLA